MYPQKLSNCNDSCNPDSDSDFLTIFRNLYGVYYTKIYSPIIITLNIILKSDQISHILEKISRLLMVNLDVVDW